ncbi:MAG: nucleotidyl transferase [Fibrobacter sp.]|nr:nucleotidyl transferase [Fibrobacter sp.]
MKIRKAVITAAARGERLYPVSDTVQKSMLPIIDTDGINKPLIQIIAEEAFSSGIEEVCIICAPGDEKKYVESFKSLHSSLLKAYKDHDWAVQQAKNIQNLLERCSFKVQKEPRGYGDAVYQAREFVKDEAFLLLLGDYLYVSDDRTKNCARQLIEIATREDCSVSAVNPTIEHLISRYGTLTGKSVSTYNGVYQIDKIIEKPSISQAEMELQTPGLRAGYYLCFFGMHVFKPVIFDFLEKAVCSGEDNILLTPSQQELAVKENYLALEMKGTRYDTSKRFGIMQAQIALSLAGCTKNEALTSIVQILAESAKRQ